MSGIKPVERQEGQRSRDHHTVPQHYLRAWSADGNRVEAYRLLVPHAKYPVWKLRSVKLLAAYEDLYTSVAWGEESDVFERWLNEAVETPAVAALDRVRNGHLPSKAEWRALATYLASLDVRTPAAYLDFVHRTAPMMKQALDSTLQSLPRLMQRAVSKGEIITEADWQQDSASRFPARISVTPNAETDRVEVSAHVTIGRELWLHMMRNAITDVAKLLHRRQWVILQPHRGSEWWTSDHPVVRLNYYSEGVFDFGGGWGNKGTEIFLPLSPNHLMYTKVGSDDVRGGELDASMTLHLQRFIARRAYRWIFSRTDSQRATWLRAREVNESKFKAEAREWAQWHRVQTAEEVTAKPRAQSGSARSA